MSEYRQLDLLDTTYENPLIDQIKKLIDCVDRPILIAVSKAIDNFRAMPLNQQYA